MSNSKKKCVADYDKVIGNEGFTSITSLTFEMKTLIKSIQSVMNNREIGKTVLDKNSGFNVFAKSDAAALDDAIGEMKHDLKENRVLISVSSKTVDRVKPLKTYLEGAGISTFLYEGAIQSGEDFNQKILNAVNDAELVICFIDDNYLCSEFSIAECIYSFVSNDTDVCLWIDSSVDIDLSDNKELQYFKLLKFIRARIQTTNIDNKKAIAKDLTKLKEFSDVDLLELNPFCEVYESMLNQKSKD